MLFNSFYFLIFFPVVTILYFLLPHKWRWLHLLVASCIFYMGFIPVYILILLITIVIDYIAGILIENAVSSKRKAYLMLSIAANVGVLAIFKYYNFFIENINALLQITGMSASQLQLWNIILPIGLSFHTFQAMSYTIEVYRGHQKAERHFGIYALYVMFYPQLVAGPIERPQNLLHQFREEHYFDGDRIARGLRLMLWGLFMKVVVADRLSTYVDPVYNNLAVHNGTTVLLAACLFSIQIYCDFAGYSYIAIGAARVMGFELMTNFKRPYFARSVSDFWSRWHISLSTWFRDYIYIPLGGNRVSMPRWYFNLFIIFLISGFWHGADWKFIIWGALHGCYLVFAIITQHARQRFNERIGVTKIPWLYASLQIFVTFLLCMFAFIFFRANTVGDAFLAIRKIFSEPGPLFTGDNPALLPYCILGLMILAFVEIKHEYFAGKFLLFNSRYVYTRYAAYIFILLLILLIGVFDGGQFIYFQF